VKLLDFGIAKMGVLQETKASVVLGTPSYMAPEQARGESVGPALDLYAMGVILFELVTGTLPYTGDTAVRVIYQHLEAPIPLPSSRNPSLPGALDTIIGRLLAKRPHERHGSAEELRRELGRLKVAVSDPSALTTIEEPIEAFDAREPLEQTFVKGRTPEPASLELGRTGVLEATRPAPAPAPAGPSTGELTKAVQPKRGPVFAIGAAAVLLGAGATWLATRSPTPPPTPAPAVVAPIPAAAGAEPSPVVAPAVAPPPASPVAEPGVAPAVAPPAPTVAEPLVGAPPAPSAVAQPNSEPAKPIERPKADDAKSGRERLQRQLKTLERNTAKAKAAGDDVQLLERQLSIVRTRREVARSPEDLEALQVALERIAGRPPRALISSSRGTSRAAGGCACSGCRRGTRSASAPASRS
jgi:serine/threonine-protein kinase